MQKTIQRRLRALERSRSKGQDCRGILLAYYLGGLRPDNPPTNLGAAHARALGFPDEQSLLKESVRTLEVAVRTGEFGRDWMMRFQQAYQRLLAHWGLEPNVSGDAWIEALNEMFEALPPKLKKWAEAVLEEDFKAQLQANEVLAALERGELPDFIAKPYRRSRSRARPRRAGTGRHVARPA